MVLKKWVNHDTQKTSLPDKFKEAVNSNVDKQKKFTGYLHHQLIKKKNEEEDAEMQKSNKMSQRQKQNQKPGLKREIKWKSCLMRSICLKVKKTLMRICWRSKMVGPPLCLHSALA